MQSITEPRKKRKYTPRKPIPFMCGWCWDIFYSAGYSSKFCSPKCRENNRYWTQRDKRSKQAREFRERHKDRINAQLREDYRINPEKYREQRRATYLRHREKRIANASEYQKKNPQVVALTRHMRKAAAAYEITQRDHRRMLERYRHSCAYCEVKLAPWGREFPNSLQWDHVLPLSKGGSDGVGNLLPVCRQCNRNKSARFLSDWRLRS